jgi:fibronectin-binding autotransporter adhesin
MKNPESSRLVASCRIFAALFSLLLLVPNDARAQFLIQAWEVGGNVQAVGYGAISTDGTSVVDTAIWFGTTWPALRGFSVGSEALAEVRTFSGLAPASLGPGGRSVGIGCGDVIGTFKISRNNLYVPIGYTSGTFLGGTAVFSGQSFASLGLNTGDYVWSWGPATNQTLTLRVGTTPVGAYWNAGSGAWNTTSGWLSGIAYGTLPTNTAYLNNGSTVSLTDSQTLTDSFMIGQTCSGGTLSLTNGGTLTTPQIDVAFKLNTSGNLNFDGGTVNAARIVFGLGTGVINFNQSDALVLTSAVSGPGRLNQLGAGTTTLQGANTYTGGTTIRRGTLNLATASAAGTGTVTLDSSASSATLQFTNSFTFTNDLVTTSTANTAAIEVAASQNVVLSNDLTGAGRITKSGDGTLALAKKILNTGGTTVAGGQLDINLPFAFVNATGNVLTVQSNAILSLGATDVFGRHTDDIFNPIVINGGTVQSGGAFYNALGPITMNGGTLVATAVHAASGYSFSLKGTVTVNSNSTISGPGITLGSAGVNSTAFDVAGGVALTVSDGLLDGPGEAWPSSQPSSLVKSGTGSLVLNGTNSYTGDTTISNGTVVVGGSGVLNNGNYDGNLNLAAAGSTLVIDTTENQSLGGIISGEGSLVKTNAGTLTISGMNNSYMGTTTIADGTLVMNGDHWAGYGPGGGSQDVGAYIVTNAGTLAGNGYIYTGVEGNGTISPGSPGQIGMLNIDRLTNFTGLLNINLDGGRTSMLSLSDETDIRNTTVKFSEIGAPLNEETYIFLSTCGGLIGPFLATSNQPTGYTLRYDFDDGVAFLQTNSATATVTALNTNGVTAVIGNGTNAILPFQVLVYNGLPVNLTNISSAGNGTNVVGGFTSTAPVLTNDSDVFSGLTFSNGIVGQTNTATFDVVLDGVTNQTTFDVLVYDHASNSVSGTNVTFAPVHRNAGLVTSTNSITVSNTSGGVIRAVMGVTNVNTNNFITIDTATSLAQGDSAELFGELNTELVTTFGRVTNNAQLIAYDDMDLAGASTNVGATGVQVISYVYTGQGVWTNSAGGTWDDFANWQEAGGTPGLDGNLSTNDTAFFGNVGGGTVYVTNTNMVQMLSITFDAGTNSYVLGGSGTFELTAAGTNPASINTLSGTNFITNAIAAGSELVLSNAAGSETYLSGVISSLSGLIKKGAGWTGLGGSNTYEGGTVLEAGTLDIGNNSALGTGAVTINNGNTGTNDTALLVDSRYWTVPTGQIVISNAITVAASSGTTTIGSSALGANSRPVEFRGPITLESNNVTLVSAEANGAGDRTDFYGGISGTGDVTITSATNSRVVFMENPNTFTGNLFITEGSTLQLSDGATNGNSLIPITAVVDVATNAFLKFAKGDGNWESIAGLTGTGMVNAAAGSNNLVLAPDVAVSSTFNGVIEDGAGVMSVAKFGAGTQTFSGNSTYTGGTIINEGTLVTASSNALGTGNVELLGGELSLDSGLTIQANFLWDASATVSILDAVSDANNLDILGNLVLTNGPTNFFSLRGTFVGSSPTKLLTSANMTTNDFDPSLFGIVGGLAGDYILTISNNALWIDADVLIVDGTMQASGTNNYGSARFIADSDPNLTLPTGSSVTIRTNIVMSNNSTVNVAGGVFGVTNPAYSTTVQSGSTLGGYGTINGAVNVSGTYAPGAGGSGTILTNNGALTFNTGGSFLWTLYANTNSLPGQNFSSITALGANKLTVPEDTEFQMFFTDVIDATNDFWDANELLTNTWTVMTGTDLAEGTAFRPVFAEGSVTNGFNPTTFFFRVTNNSLTLNYSPGLVVFPGPDEFLPGNNNYPWVIFEPNAELEVPVGVNVVIKTNVTISNNSTVLINGQFTSLAGQFAMQNGSSLGGNGTINGNLVSSGLISPGNSPGTLSIGGNFTQTAAGTFLLEAASTSNFDRLNVSGSAAVDGTLQAVGFGGNNLSPGDRYQFLTANGGISGDFDTISLPAGLRGSFLISGVNNSLGTLLIAPSTYTSMALTPNQFNAAAALDNFIGAGGDRGTVSAALDTLTASQYPAAFEQVMPSQYASLPTMAFNVANALNSSMFQQLWVIRVNGKGFNASGVNMAPMQAEMGGTDDMGVFAINPSKDTKWSSFVDGNGVFANASSTGSTQNYRSQSGGVSTGAAYSWNDAFATGVYVGYQGLQAEYDSGRTIDNAVRFGVFGTYDIEDFYFNALVGGAYHGYTVNRYINFGGLNRTATGRPGAGEFDLALGTGYDFDIGNFSWGPFTTLQYTYMAVQGFTEAGADSLNLDVDPYNSSSLLYTLGAQAAYNWKVSDKVIITPTAFAGWQHEFLQNSYGINSTFATGGPAAPFNYNTSSPARDNFYGGVGVTVGVGESWQATFIYSASAANQDNSSQNLYLGLGYKF